MPVCASGILVPENLLLVRSTRKLVALTPQIAPQGGPAPEAEKDGPQTNPTRRLPCNQKHPYFPSKIQPMYTPNTQNCYKEHRIIIYYASKTSSSASTCFMLNLV